MPYYPTSHLQTYYSVRERRAQNGLIMKRLTEQFINVTKSANFEMSGTHWFESAKEPIYRQ